jgi:hypothetical protein
MLPNAVPPASGFSAHSISLFIQGIDLTSHTGLVSFSVINSPGFPEELFGHAIVTPEYPWFHALGHVHQVGLDYYPM